MIVNFYAPRYPGVVQNVVAFGFAPQGAVAGGGLGTTGFQQQFYWNSKLVAGTNQLIRFGQGQFGVSSAAPAPIKEPDAGGWIVSHFSRKQFDELKAAERAAEEAERRARELKESKRKQVLKAVKAAEDAIEEAREHEHEVGIDRLTRALEATAKAKKVLDVVEASRRVAELARQIMEEIDEEEATMLLLMH